jgi:serine/threonine protein phosphatase PrpC
MKNSRLCVQIVSGTDVGCVRGNNEDAVGQDERVGLAILADGMGGHKAGEVASAMAVGTILNELPIALDQLEPGSMDIETGYTKDSILLQQAIEKANLAIHETAVRCPAYEGMGTTVVVAAFYNGYVSVAHVGDSRLYRLRADELIQITTDHSVAHELIAKGYFQTLEEVAAAGMKNAITRSLGTDPAVQVDIVEDSILPGDIYLLCSDGLTDMVTDAEIQTIVENHGENLHLAVEQLINAAKQNGGRDNVSVVLVRPLKTAIDSELSWYRRLARWSGNLFVKGN